MKLDTILRRYTRRNYSSPFPHGPKTIDRGYVKFDPDCGFLSIDAEQLYADIIMKRPHKEIVFSSPLIKEEVDYLADKIEDYVSQFLGTLANGGEQFFAKINANVVQIARNSEYELVEMRGSEERKKKIENLKNQMKKDYFGV